MLSFIGLTSRQEPRHSAIPRGPLVVTYRENNVDCRKAGDPTAESVYAAVIHLGFESKR